MKDQIVHLKKDDYTEAMEMMQLAFEGFDFPVQLPKLYAPDDKKMHWNLAVKAGGSIKAIVGAYPMTLIAGGHPLNTVGIGGVSVHPDARGKGYMRCLMDTVMEAMRAQGVQLACLGGARHRYNHWGFEKAGTQLEFEFDHGDMQHYRHRYDLQALQFVPIEEADTDKLEKAAAYYASQPVRVDRPIHEFYAFLKSWSFYPWAAINQQGEMSGYLTANENGDVINEIGAETPHILGQILYTWTKDRHKHPKLLLPSWQPAWIKEVGQFAESFLQRDAYSFCVLDWPAVTKAFLQAKASYSILPDGEAVVEIRGRGKLCLRVCQGVPACTPTDQTPDLSLSESEAIRFMFGPLPPQSVSMLLPAKAPLLSAWFPLPLSWLPQDGI